MERIHMVNSAKDIPIPSHEVYMKALIDKTNSLIRRVRWRIFHADMKRKNQTGGVPEEDAEIKKHFKVISVVGNSRVVIDILFLG